MSDKIQIDKKTFYKCLNIIAFGSDDTKLWQETKQELLDKLDSIIKRELYTKYKTAPTEEEREQARQEYLNKVGMNKDFRW